MNDEFGERIKNYEIERQLFSNYLCIRIDGNAFTKWVYSNKIAKPFSLDLHSLFVDTASFLIKECNGILAYTQSDEISIILHKKPGQEHYLGGKVQKICSLLSSFTTKAFNDMAPDSYKPATFDCRVFPLPSDTEAANTILWRIQDCARNSILQTTLGHYKQSEIEGKSVKECIQLLKEKHIDWELLSNRFKYGTIIKFTKDGSGKRLLHEVIPDIRPTFYYIFNMIQKDI